MRTIKQKSKKFAGGFTLVETIAANVILCGAVVTLGAIGTVCLTQTKLNSQYETAANLADRQLSLIDYIGIDTFVQQGQFEEELKVRASNMPGARILCIWKSTTCMR